MGILKTSVTYGYLQSISFSVKKKKPPMCLSGGMTEVQGVRHSLKRKQKDEDYEMQPQLEVVNYKSCVLRMSSLRESNCLEYIHALYSTPGFIHMHVVTRYVSLW